VAVAVAARLAGVGLAVDAGGEALVPAAHCGAVALRPSPGRYPHRGLLALHPTLDALTVVARTVGDVTLVDGVLAAAAAAAEGVPAAERQQAGASAAPSTTTTTTSSIVPAAATTEPAEALALQGARIGVLRQSQLFPAPSGGGGSGTTVDPAVDAVVAGALQRLAKAGAVLVDVELPPEVMGCVRITLWWGRLGCTQRDAAVTAYSLKPKPDPRPPPTHTRTRAASWTPSWAPWRRTRRRARWRRSSSRTQLRRHRSSSQAALTARRARRGRRPPRVSTGLAVGAAPPRPPPLLLTLSS
jgi:Asp-tRNA(Asn)/Glu-tRNA(Gln) amidotransferase A subunit family amidase